jgi:hypothetical protein
VSEIYVEVVGVEPPCKMCQATLKNVEEAASELKTSGINVRVSKLNMASKDVIAKYGVLVSPSLVVNGVVKIVGRVPDKKEVEKILRTTIK